MSKQAAIFVGHGDPMMALRDDDIAHALRAVGKRVEAMQPKAILAVSAHWFVPHTFVESDPHPRQVIDYHALPYDSYAVPTPDHFLPLPTVLGASSGEEAEVFNNVQNLGSMSMTSYAFGLA